MTLFIRKKRAHLSWWVGGGNHRAFPFTNSALTLKSTPDVFSCRICNLYVSMSLVWLAVELWMLTSTFVCQFQSIPWLCGVVCIIKVRRVIKTTCSLVRRQMTYGCIRNTRFSGLYVYKLRALWRQMLFVFAWMKYFFQDSAQRAERQDDVFCTGNNITSSRHIVCFASFWRSRLFWYGEKR